MWLMCETKNVASFRYQYEWKNVVFHKNYPTFKEKPHLITKMKRVERLERNCSFIHNFFVKKSEIFPFTGEKCGYIWLFITSIQFPKTRDFDTKNLSWWLFLQLACWLNHSKRSIKNKLTLCKNVVNILG